MRASRRLATRRPASIFVRADNVLDENQKRPRGRLGEVALLRQPKRRRAPRYDRQLQLLQRPSSRALTALSATTASTTRCSRLSSRLASPSDRGKRTTTGNDRARQHHTRRARNQIHTGKAGRLRPRAILQAFGRKAAQVGIAIRSQRNRHGEHPPFATHDSHVRCFGNPQRVTIQGIWYKTRLRGARLQRDRRRVMGRCRARRRRHGQRGPSLFGEKAHPRVR